MTPGRPFKRPWTPAPKPGEGRSLLPPGEYTSGTIHLRSHVRFYIDGGATLYASTKSADFDKRSLLYAEDAQNITIEGRGTLEGQAAYEWRANKQRYNPDIEVNRVHAQAIADAAEKQLLRPYPTESRAAHDSSAALQGREDCRTFVPSFPKLDHPPLRLPASDDRRHLHLHQPERGGLGRWHRSRTAARTCSISNCTIETGDDAIVFYSTDAFGPALPCENITVTNCRLSSASAALEVLRLQRQLRPQRDGGQLRDHRLEPRNRLHGRARRLRG